ncbi:MAG: phosphoribosyltransferase family protein [Polyangiaceae bacterium]
MAWSPIVRALVEILAPSGCAACDVPVRVPRRGTIPLFCPTCDVAAILDPVDDPAVLAPYAYGGAVATALHRFKYRERPDLGGRLGAAMGGYAVRRALRADLVVPVPLSRARLVERGYNQASILAATVARSIESGFAPTALSRTGEGAVQVGRRRAERFRNVASLFAVARPERIAGKDVLLVDDVRTTGATSEACARVLRAAGARSVTVLVFARAEER